MADPRLAEIRRQMAARYAQASKDEKPHIKMCEFCGQPTYQSKVCTKSGLLHDMDKHQIIGGVSTDADKRIFTGEELIGAINAVRVKWQAARTKKVQVDQDAASIFQTFVWQRQWKLQRCGIMYGTVNTADNSVAVHCIYEPEQTGNELSFELLKDEREDRIDKLAGMLGLQRIGLVVTTPPRDANETVLTGKELLMLAKEQSRFGDHCVILTISPNPETQEINATAWQATEQAVRLFQLGLLSPSEKDQRYVTSSKPLEVAQDKDEQGKGKHKMIIKEPSTEVDAQWMTGYCAVESIQSDIIGSRFIRISRPGEAPPDLNNLKNFLNDPKRNRLPFVQQIADFHVLIFLMEVVGLSAKDDMPIICDAVMNKNATRLQAYEDMIKMSLKP